VSAVATVAINVDARDATGQLRQLQTQSNLTERAFGSLASALATLGVGIGLSKVLSDVKELDTNLRRLATVGGDVAQLDKALGDLSERLGGVASKAELAAASYQAASAGFSDTAGNVRILEAATKAAVGGLASAEGVTEVLVKTLNAYGMAGTDAYKVTDLIMCHSSAGLLQSLHSLVSAWMKSTPSSHLPPRTALRLRSHSPASVQR
jgi:hypothetical protein